MKYLTLLLGLSCCLMSCGSKELNKEKATEILSQAFGLPLQTRIAIDQKYDNYGWPPNIYKQAAEKNLLDIKLSSKSFLGTTYNATLTNESKKYYIQNAHIDDGGERISLMVFKGFIVSIKDLSISSLAKEKKADGRLLLEATDLSPIQELFSPLEIKEVLILVSFQLFDDGWKLSSIQNSENLFNPLAIPLHWASASNIIYDASGPDLPQGNSDNNAISEGNSLMCSASSKFQVIISGKNVRLRSEPDITKDNVMLLLDKDIKVILLEDKQIENTKWYKICYNGKIGWVSSQFASLLNSTSNQVNNAEPGQIPQDKNNNNDTQDLESHINDLLENKYNSKYRVVTDNDKNWDKYSFDNFVLPERKKFKYYPYIVKGDFNGDGVSDLAAEIINTENKNTQLAIIWSGNNDLKVYKGQLCSALSFIPASEWKSHWEQGSVYLNADAILVTCYEQSAWILYWDGNSFQQFWMSD